MWQKVATQKLSCYDSGIFFSPSLSAKVYFSRFIHSYTRHTDPPCCWSSAGAPNTTIPTHQRETLTPYTLYPLSSLSWPLCTIIIWAICVLCLCSCTHSGQGGGNDPLLTSVTLWYPFPQLTPLALYNLLTPDFQIWWNCNHENKFMPFLAVLFSSNIFF